MRSTSPMCSLMVNHIKPIWIRKGYLNTLAFSKGEDRGLGARPGGGGGGRA